MKEIDLHGYRHSEALSLTENEVLLNLQEVGSKIKVITGNSPTLQKKIVKQIVEKYKFSYYIMSYNLGAIIIINK